MNYCLPNWMTYKLCIACLYLHTFLTSQKKSLFYNPPVQCEWIMHVGGCLTWCVTSLISDMIFLYQLAQARPHNVLHFLVVLVLCGRWPRNKSIFILFNGTLYCSSCEGSSILWNMIVIKLLQGTRIQSFVWWWNRSDNGTQSSRHRSLSHAQWLS